MKITMANANYRDLRQIKKIAFYRNFIASAPWTSQQLVTLSCAVHPCITV